MARKKREIKEEEAIPLGYEVLGEIEYEDFDPITQEELDKIEKQLEDGTWEAFIEERIKN
jgi:hypothetical protein